MNLHGMGTGFTFTQTRDDTTRVRLSGDNHKYHPRGLVNMWGKVQADDPSISAGYTNPFYGGAYNIEVDPGILLKGVGTGFSFSFEKGCARYRLVNARNAGLLGAVKVKGPRRVQYFPEDAPVFDLMLYIEVYGSFLKEQSIEEANESDRQWAKVQAAEVAERVAAREKSDNAVGAMVSTIKDFLKESEGARDHREFYRCLESAVRVEEKDVS